MQKSRQSKKSRSTEKHEAADTDRNNQVTRINPSEKASMAMSIRYACLFP